MSFWFVCRVAPGELRTRARVVRRWPISPGGVWRAVGRVGAAVLAMAPLWVAAFVPDRTGTGQPVRWLLSPPSPLAHTNVVNPSTRAVRFFLGADAYSEANRAAELDALRASFGQWESVPGAEIRFEEAGLLPTGIDINTEDHTNVVFWATQSTLVNGGNDDISGLLGLTFTHANSDGVMLEADLVLNGVEFGWFTDANNTVTRDQFVEGTAVHELGHVLGFAHTPVGGATLLAFSGHGLRDSQIGLAPDDVAGARALYPEAPGSAALATLKGRVTRSGNSVFGAVVTAEDRAGLVQSGTLTRPTGDYELLALPAGDYRVRVTPLDPCGVPGLMCGASIGGDYASSETKFLATTNTSVSLAEQAIQTLNLKVTSGTPPFRIAYLLSPTLTGVPGTLLAGPVQLQPGQTNVLVGVASPNLPTSGVSLSVTGDGLTLGPTQVDTASFGGQVLLMARLDIASNATPGLRTFMVQKGTSRAYANGYLDLRPRVRDDNFDGLDDAFQRRYFPVFTAPDAAPDGDPDHDTMSNADEAVAGTVPTHPASTLRIDSVRVEAGGCRVTWRSVKDRRYQLFGRDDVAEAPWLTVGGPVAASGTNTTVVDPKATGEFRFYRVQVLP